MPVHYGSGSEPFYLIGHVGRLLWRYRAELAPLYWLAGCLLAGSWLHKVHPNWWPLIVLAGIAGIVVLAVRPAKVLARFPLLERWRVRVWGAGFIAFVTQWLTAATIHGATAGPMESFAIIGTGVFAVPWLWREDRRRLTRVRIIRDHFPDTADAAGLTGARMVSAVMDKWGWTARIKLRRGQTYSDVVKALPELESALGARIGGTRAEPVTDDASQFTLRLVETDPHAQPIVWEPRAVPVVGKSRASITQPVTVGVFEDGAPITVPLLRKHVLIGGATDSGKSGLLNVILARIAECGDAIAWGIDLKKGMELAPWSSVLQILATDNDSAERLLQAGVDELEKRAEFLMGRGRREWYPKFDAPQLFIIIDEYAELSKKAQRLADSISRRGRAVAVVLLIATQRPTQKAMGESSALRSQMNIRFCLRVNERPDVDLILGVGKLSAGWDATKFDGPGKFFVSGPGMDTPRRGRAYLITDADVTETATTYARPGSAADQLADTAGTGRPESRSQRLSGGPETIGAPATVSGPEMALWATLRDAPPEGVTAGVLQDATGKGRAWVYKRLKAGQADTTIASPSYGRWRAVRPPAGDPCRPARRQHRPDPGRRHRRRPRQPATRSLTVTVHGLSQSPGISRAPAR
ncbi:S-DNA-T family DNA segregation ATPase FtsK/SpoIIIE [Kribbella aluminosa]|uniref:S-DNA-T family DNA segregation ATPase FtsK/SpoIIIE n=1 Tax=Kribbella aluminosa TaxID=416017 RepID=A0ABS4UNP5_9ACTN|nr:FtsK/SpoIIIE domain-containing protein [Kribbella aluminosa]MBP2353265.1 S-DNA-T family DNA segregation ATPase FtsK/SpoIIIE [Kribbella aluminosa]